MRKVPQNSKKAGSLNPTFLLVYQPRNRLQNIESSHDTMLVGRGGFGEPRPKNSPQDCFLNGLFESSF